LGKLSIEIRVVNILYRGFSFFFYYSDEILIQLTRSEGYLENKAPLNVIGSAFQNYNGFNWKPIQIKDDIIK